MTQPSTQDRFLSLAGLRFHYLSWGEETAPPLLLLHGAWWHAHVWDALAEVMSDRYRVLALDQRGHGETDWAEDYAWQRWVEDLEAFVEALRVKHLSLVGHSMGGWIAYMFAARHPELVERLVIVDIGPEHRTPTLGQIQAQAAMLTEQQWSEPEQALSAIRDAVPGAEERLLEPAVRQNLKPLEEGGWTWRYDTRRRSTGRRDRRPDAQTQWLALREIRCPVLLIRGGKGILAAETAERMSHEIQNCRIEQFPSSGHNPHLEDSVTFLRLVREFLNDAGGGRSSSAVS